MRDLIRAWYSVWTDAPEGARVLEGVPLETLAHLLPHGSGIDSDWYVDVRKAHGKARPAGFTCTTKFHAMNEYGYYCGWYPVRVVVDCYRVLYRGRDVVRLTTRSVRCSSQGPMYGTRDMIEDDFAMVVDCLNDEADVCEGYGL